MRIARDPQLDGGVFEGSVVRLFIGQSPAVLTGTMSITNEGTFPYNMPPYPEAGSAFIQLAIPGTPPSQGRTGSSSVSGSLTLIKVGTEWAGNFTATMVDAKGNQNPLSGSFDTSGTCGAQ